MEPGTTHSYKTHGHVDRILGLFLSYAYGSRDATTRLAEIASRNNIRVVYMQGRQTVNGVPKWRRLTAD